MLARHSNVILRQRGKNDFASSGNHGNARLIPKAIVHQQCSVKSLFRTIYRRDNIFDEKTDRFAWRGLVAGGLKNLSTVAYEKAKID